MADKFDLFISYSSKDKKYVSELAKDLQTKGLRVWFDQWEMRPGDRLRDRINSGIRGSRFFLVVLSPNSINASWVKIELDSAMIRELEEQRVVVIPLLKGRISNSDIPGDLKGKNYLDVRKRGGYSKGIERLLAQFDLDKRKQREYLRYLREGALSESLPIDKLANLACSRHDQIVQRAALTGLSKHSDPAATLAIAKRLLDSWGKTTLSHCIKICTKMADRGGLILLSATLFYDDRLIHEKLNSLKKTLHDIRYSASIKILDGIGDLSEIYRNADRANDWLQVIKKVPNQDVREGVIFGSKFDGFWGWPGRVMAKPTKDEFQRAKSYVESRIPGLPDLFNKQLSDSADRQ